VRANALADGVPHSDLHVSAEHSLFLDGALVPAGLLVNGASISACPTYGDVSYFHVELDSHDVILAEGAPVETFVDAGSRAMFDNAAEFATLYGDEAPQALCAPLLDSGADLAAIQARIAARSGIQSVATDDPGLHLVVNGRTVQPDTAADGFASFTVPSGAHDIRIASRHVVPAQLGLSGDRRSLGVAFRTMVLRSGTCSIEINPGSPSLQQGFHAAETGHRWTDGQAVLPAQMLAAFPAGCTQEVAFAALPIYLTMLPLAA